MTQNQVAFLPKARKAWTPKTLTMLMPQATKHLQTTVRSITAKNALTIYGDQDAFSRMFSPEKQRDVAFNVRLFLTSSETPTLKLIGEMYGKDFCLAWLLEHLNSLNYLSGKEDKKMSADAIMDTALVIMSQYCDLRASDIMLFAVQFKAGQYGEIYGALDGVKITNSLQKFVLWRNNKLNEYARLRNQEEQEIKHEYEDYAKAHETIAEFATPYGTCYAHNEPKPLEWLASNEFRQSFALLSSEEANLKRDAIKRKFGIDIEAIATEKTAEIANTN